MFIVTPLKNTPLRLAFAMNFLNAQRKSLIIYFAALILLSASPPAWCGDGDKAQIEFQVPDGAKIAIDGKDIGDLRTFTLEEMKPKEFRRLKVLVKFADGGEDERLIDAESG